MIGLYIFKQKRHTENIHLFLYANYMNSLDRNIQKWEKGQIGIIIIIKSEKSEDNKKT